MDAITIQNVHKRYPGFELKDVSLSLPQGTILGLVGENGAGKSTLINLIMGAIRPDSGSITVLGEDNRSAGFSALKEEIGVVLDEACFPGDLTPAILGRVMQSTYRRWDQALYQSYLDQFSLPEKKAFKTFSRGMQMKLSIAVALSHHPRLLVLDEATGGLDPVVREEILELFSDFTREEDHSVLLSSHILSDLEKISDYIAFLRKGQLMLFEEKDRLLEDYAILRLTPQQLADLPEDAVLSSRGGAYGQEVLARRKELPTFVTPEHASLEDIVLFLVKGGMKQ